MTDGETFLALQRAERVAQEQFLNALKLTDDARVQEALKAWQRAQKALKQKLNDWVDEI